MEENKVIDSQRATKNQDRKDMLDCDELLSQNKMELTNAEVSLVQEVTANSNNIGENHGEDENSRGFKRQSEKEELIKGIFSKGTMEIEEERMQNSSCSSVSLKDEKLTQQIIALSDKNKGSLKRKMILESSEDENDDESYNNQDTDKDSKTKKRKLNGNNLLAVLGLTQWSAQPGAKHETAAPRVDQQNMTKQVGSKKRKSAVQKDDRKEYPSEGKVKQGHTEKENVEPAVEHPKGGQVQKQTKNETTGGSHEEEEIIIPKPKRKYQQRKKPAAKEVTVANKEEEKFMQNVLEFLEEDKPQPKKKAPANSRRKNDNNNNSFIEKIEQKYQAEAAQQEQERLKKSIQEQQEFILKQKLAVEEQQRQLQIQIQLRAEKQQRLEQQQKQQALLSKQRQKQTIKIEQQLLEQQQPQEEEKAAVQGKQELETEQLDNKLRVNQNQQHDGKMEESTTQISNNLLEDQGQVQQQQQLQLATNDSELISVISNVKSEPIKEMVPLVVKQEQLLQQQNQFSYPQVLPPQLLQQQFMMMQQNMQLQALFQQMQQNQQNPQFPFLLQQQAQQQQFVQNGTFIPAGMQQVGGMILPNQQLVFNQVVEMEGQEQFEVKDEDVQQSVSSNIPLIPVATPQQSITKSTTQQVQLEQIKEETIEEEQDIAGKTKKQAPKRTKKPQQPKVLEDSFDGEQIDQDVPKSKAKSKARFSTKKLNDSSPDDTLDEDYTGNAKASSRSKQTTEKAQSKPNYRESDLKILQGKPVKTEDVPDKKKHTKQQDKAVESNSSKGQVEDQKKNGNANENQLFEQNDKFLKLMQKYSKPATTAAAATVVAQEKENKNPIAAKTIPSSSSTSKIDNFIENLQKSKGSQSSATTKESTSLSPEDELKNVENLPKIGHFRYGDKPSEIISSRIINGIIYIEIEWKPRINQFRPSTSIISTEEIKLFDKDFLIEYYESKILKSNSSKASNVSSKSKADILHKIQNSSVAYTTLMNNKNNNNTNGTLAAGSLAQQSKKDGENSTKDDRNNNALTQNAITNSGQQQKRKQIDLMSEKTIEEEIEEEDANEIKKNTEKQQQLSAEKEKDISDSNGAFYENPYAQFMISQGALVGGYDQVLAKTELSEKDKENRRGDINSKGKESLNNEKPKEGGNAVAITDEMKIVQNEKQQLELGSLNGKSKDNEDNIDQKANGIDVQTAGTVDTQNRQNNLDTEKKDINDYVRTDDTKINQIKQKPQINLNDQIEEEWETNMNKSY